jgi:hypothetical protein
MADSASFWAKKLGGQAPPQQPPPHVQQQASPVTPGAWWQAPSGIASPPPGQPPPQDSGAYQPAQMYADQQYTAQQLKSMRADEMTQEQMEQLAVYELQGSKYNTACPACGSTNFLPQGTRVGNMRMGTDKCFECGASSSALTMSPEPAPAGGGTSKSTRHARQTEHGGQGSYGKHHSQLPGQYVPTRG